MVLCYVRGYRIPVISFLLAVISGLEGTFIFPWKKQVLDSKVFREFGAPTRWFRVWILAAKLFEDVFQMVSQVIVIVYLRQDFEDQASRYSAIVSLTCSLASTVLCFAWVVAICSVDPEKEVAGGEETEESGATLAAAAAEKAEQAAQKMKETAAEVKEEQAVQAVKQTAQMEELQRTVTEGKAIMEKTAQAAAQAAETAAAQAAETAAALQSARARPSLHASESAPTLEPEGLDTPRTAAAKYLFRKESSGASGAISNRASVGTEGLQSARKRASSVNASIVQEEMAPASVAELAAPAPEEAPVAAAPAPEAAVPEEAAAPRPSVRPPPLTLPSGGPASRWAATSRPASKKEGSVVRSQSASSRPAAAGQGEWGLLPQQLVAGALAVAKKAVSWRELPNETPGDEEAPSVDVFDAPSAPSPQSTPEEPTTGGAAGVPPLALVPPQGAASSSSSGVAAAAAAPEPAPASELDC